MKSLLIISLIYLTLLSAINSYAGDDKRIEAYIIHSDNGAEISHIVNNILSNRSKADNYTQWLNTDTLYGTSKNKGIFIKSRLDPLARVDPNSDYIVEYRISRLEREIKKNLSIPYLMNRFSKYLYAELDYKIMDPKSIVRPKSGKFEFRININKSAQFFEYEPNRTDNLLNAVDNEMIYNELAHSIADTISTQLEKIKKGGYYILF